VIRELDHFADIPALAGAQDFVGYPDGYEEHTARNHPAFVRSLIAWAIGYSSSSLRRRVPHQYTIWDPQAGSGTTIFEANRLGYAGRGWDIQPQYRRFWQEFALEQPEPGTVASITTSPWFDETNHSPGATKRQQEIRKDAGTTAGCQSPHELPPGHLATARDLSHWMALCRPVIRKCLEALEPGGLCLWIIRDRIKNGMPAAVPELNYRLMEREGFEMLGGISRPLRATVNEQLRASGAEKAFIPGQGSLLGGVIEFTPPPSILIEWALIGRKP
jgi:DNA modification methylase